MRSITSVFVAFTLTPLAALTLSLAGCDDSSDAIAEVAEVAGVVEVTE